MNASARQPAAGFSLVELMIAVAIVGIIAAFAYPGYRNYITEARRTDGHALITQMAARQERYYADNNTYADSAELMGYADDEVDSAEGFWTAEVDSGDASGFQIEAVVNGGHKDDACNVLAINARGQKGYKPKSGALAWDGGNCW